MRALSVITILAAFVFPSGYASAFPPINISAEELQMLRTWAAQGNALAQNNLGLVYDLGNGVSQDYVVARQWYEQAAAQNHAAAQFNLGLLYANGHGVPQDYAMAREWYEKAAALGELWVAVFLGELYSRGHGVQQDFVQAEQWFQRAADQGNEQAQVYLGELYAKGQGVPQDDVRAYMWWSLALAQEVCYQQYEATKNRDEVAQRMTPAQLAEAIRLVQEYQARTLL
jgi:TPR repeat protein